MMIDPESHSNSPIKLSKRTQYPQYSSLISSDLSTPKTAEPKTGLRVKTLPSISFTRSLQIGEIVR
jgi:hypothetical protein